MEKPNLAGNCDTKVHYETCRYVSSDCNTTWSAVAAPAAMQTRKMRLSKFIYLGTENNKKK